MIDRKPDPMPDPMHTIMRPLKITQLVVSVAYSKKKNQKQLAKHFFSQNGHIILKITSRDVPTTWTKQ